MTKEKVSLQKREQNSECRGKRKGGRVVRKGKNPWLTSSQLQRSESGGPIRTPMEWGGTGNAFYLKTIDEKAKLQKQGNSAGRQKITRGEDSPRQKTSQHIRRWARTRKAAWESGGKRNNKIGRGNWDLGKRNQGGKPCHGLGDSRPGTKNQRSRKEDGIELIKADTKEETGGSLEATSRQALTGFEKQKEKENSSLKNKLTAKCLFCGRGEECFGGGESRKKS